MRLPGLISLSNLKHYPQENHMAAIKNFINKSVGEKGVNQKSDVKKLQQLLIAAGETVTGGDDGVWGSNTAKALESFQTKYQSSGVKIQKLLSPEDYCLLLMAWKANILIPLPGKAGTPGVLAMHDWFVKNSIKYNSGAEKGGGNRAIYGVAGDNRYAVQTIEGKFATGPIQMDCTTYVNLMLSVYTSGSCHIVPYDASCADFGACSAAHCARDRYNLPLVTRAQGDKIIRHFENADQIRDATHNSAGIHAIEVALAGTGSVTHMALLIGGTVYECTTGQSGSACISRPVEEFCKKKGKIYYLFGPSQLKL